ncbi:hypothetical protein EAH68_12850 [Corynebacterium hylobatis]|uniref:Uncharacterized protein n=1 Tax=Corynebacterium hylobatis TaxID=1859290 RepID=A0A430HVQ2_9CORY|nr:hypothetical protein [Corynebacterium hylobatis]RSZ61544.1 hypothetical protein EAH68_12850 [Corynebacterium hylobatis]
MSEVNHQFSRINPYPVPAGKHPWIPLLVRPSGIAFDEEVLEAIATHMEKVGFIHLGWMEIVHDVRVVVGLPPKGADDLTAQPGEPFEWLIPDGWKSHCRHIGQLPPGIELVGDRLVGVCAMPGVWSFQIIVGPGVKFDGLGHGGAPLEPGEWISVDQEPAVISREVDGIDLTTKSRQELDDIIAQAMAVKQDKRMQEVRDQ